MKNFYRLFSPFTMAFFFALSLQLNAQAQSKAAVVSNINQNSRADYVFNLPFIEDWEYHSFTHNLWETSDDAWAIDVYNGNDGASAMFQGSSNQTNYSSTLTSNWLSGSAVGKDTLRFDLKLSDLAANGTEFFFIKIFDGTTYHTIDSIANNGSFDWTNYTYVITDATAGNDFKVVFEASGVASSNILDWHIDNIEVFRECDPPTKLWGQFIDCGDNNICCSINWDIPDCLQPIEPWEHWDSGENLSGIGLTNGGNFSVAARWDAGSLGVKNGDTISKIQYYINDNQFDYLVLHIWTGDNAANVIYSDTIINPIAGMWNMVNINEPIILDASLEYWIGYDIVNQVAGTFPAGTDAGPAIAGYGDKISTDGNTWDNLSDFGLNCNWNVEMYVEHAPPVDSTLKMFVVYKSVEWEDYQPFDTVNYVIGQLYFEYLDNNNISYDSVYRYKVNAVWTKDGDTCVSPFARNWYMPIYDFIVIIPELIPNENNTNTGITLYPNPATNTITIDAENELTNIIVYDLTGKEVLKINPLNGNKVSINIASLQSGIYLIKAKTASGVLFRKFIKQ